tara:strand:+ start:215 stop:457 length:243 start_codon:yes stop_codon:yes gene_type:complete
MTKTTKIRAQVKSRWYYLFWGAATISVFAGQIYVGNGFRRMAESNDGISADINLLVETLIYSSSGRSRSNNYFEQDMVVR